MLEAIKKDILQIDSRLESRIKLFYNYILHI